MSDPHNETTGAATLVWGDRVIWTNPSNLGHAGIKLRKQVREYQIVENMERRRIVRHAFGGGILHGGDASLDAAFDDVPDEPALLQAALLGGGV